MIFFTDGIALNFLLGGKRVSPEYGCNFGLRWNYGRSWVLFPMGSLGFFSDLILPAALWPKGQVRL